MHRDCVSAALDVRSCVLSSAEAIVFLRLDSENPLDTLAYCRKIGKLRGRRLGKHLVYLLPDLLSFVESLD